MVLSEIELDGEAYDMINDVYENNYVDNSL